MMFLLLVLSIYAILGVATLELSGRYTMEQLTGNDIRYRLLQRNADKTARRWTNAEVPYVFDSGLQTDRRNVIKNAIEAYNKHTCMRFIPKTASHTDYIRFMDGGDGNCYSYIGRQGGSQDIGIGDGCQYQIGIVLHEMAHAIGFLHEHNRPDRDNYVTIKFDRIRERSKANFKKNTASDVDLYDTRYDYLSMMHYGRSYFSETGGDTVITTDSKYQDKIGQRQNFSICDLEKINRHYSCTKYIDPTNPCKLTTPPPLPQSTTPATPKPCEDDPTFNLCKHVREKPGICDQLPGAFLLRCKKSCNNCDGSKCYDSKHEMYSKICRRLSSRKVPCAVGQSKSASALVKFCPLTCAACKSR